MSKIVFVLGAGASAHCGTPLMNNFLEVAEGLWRAGEVDKVSEHFKKVFDAIGNLQGIHSKAKLDTYNVETIYAAFEMGKLLDSLPGVKENSEIGELISSIKKVIGYTLERTTKLTNDSEQKPSFHIAYFQFVDIINKLMEQGKDFSIITFNYDLGLDYSLQYLNMTLDYGFRDIFFDDRRRLVLFLKLHGSLNWGKCVNSKCKKITPCGQLKRQVNDGYSIIPVISRLKREKCLFCRDSLEEDPFIVPPTWNKTAYHTEIDQVWKRAALELKDAENIFVLGYSLPSTDLFFHYLFALGVDTKTILKGFYVYNTDPTAEERFQNLLGSGIEQRFQFYKAPFEDAVGEVPTGNIGYLGLLRRILGIS